MRTLGKRVFIVCIWGGIAHISAHQILKIVCHDLGEEMKILDSRGPTKALLT